jgi:hypothetical protein
MHGTKNILEKVSKGHLEQNTIMVVKVTKIMWNIVVQNGWGIGGSKQ